MGLMDRRRLAAYAVVVVFMVVTMGHVAAFTGSMEPEGWAWLGWPYALAVDASIAICAWLTRWKTTERWAWVGYLAFTVASGLLNVAQVRPGSQESALGAWVYALFPTFAIALLGFLARDASKFRVSSGGSAGSSADGPAREPVVAAQSVFVCDCTAEFGSQNALNAHRRWCAGALISDNGNAVREYDGEGLPTLQS